MPRRFTTRLMFSYLLVLGVVLAVFLPLMSYRVKSLIRDQVAERLHSQAVLAVDELAPLMKNTAAGDARLRKFTMRYADRSGCRLTLVDAAGVVLADSDVPPERLAAVENHALRPEIVQAREKGWGWSVRHSATVGKDFLYGAYAVPLKQGMGFIRLAVPVQDTQEIIWHFREALFFGFGLALAAGAAMGWALSLILAGGIKKISLTASRIAEGDFSPQPASTGTDELDALADSLDAMKNRLKQSFESLAEEKNMLGATLGGMTEAVLALDPGGKVLFVNAPAEAVLELAQGQAQGRPVHEILRNADFARLLEEARLSPGGLHRGEMTLNGPPERFFSVTVTALTGEEGRAAGEIVVFSDVTEMKRLLRLRSEFVANVSHEIKTPLTAIRASLETLADGALEDPEVNRDFLGKARRHTDRLSALIEDLLALSDIEEKHRRGAAPEGTSGLDEALAVSWGLVEAKADPHGVSLVPPGNSGLKVKMEAASLVRVFNNLLDNAVKYSPAGAEIRVEFEASPGVAKIWVKDRGTGIPAEELPRLFERFYRVDKARSRELGGTGLGLSIVKHLVESAGGQVGVESKPGAGSQFWFVLPVAETSPLPPSTRS